MNCYCIEVMIMSMFLFSARMKQMEKELSQLREQVAKKDATISAPSPNRTNGERLINSAPRKGAMRCKEIHQTTRVQPRSGSITGM